MFDPCRTGIAATRNGIFFDGMDGGYVFPGISNDMSK